jgi:hypothetical protein
MSFEKDELVDLLVEGGWRKAKVLAASFSGKYLALRIDGTSPTLAGVFYDMGGDYYMMLLNQNWDGSYRDYASGEIVEVRRP